MKHHVQTLLRPTARRLPAGCMSATTNAGNGNGAHLPNYLTGTEREICEH
jgi:hypothetical protein